MSSATPSAFPSSAPAAAWTLSSVPASAEAHAIAEWCAGRVSPLPAPASLLHVSVNGRAMEAMRAALAFFAPHIEVLSFPAWDCMPYDRVSPLPQLMAERLHVLATLANPKKPKQRIVLTTANALLQRLPPIDAMRAIGITLAVKQSIERDELIDKLHKQGYRRSGKAMEPGEFAVRGGIIDIIPAGSSEGVRIDLFGDDIESLRRFDPLTQVTQGTQERLDLYPISEITLNETSIQHFREQYRELFGAVTKDDPLYESISESRAWPGMEHWLPLFYAQLDTLFSYLPDAAIIVGQGADAAIKERQEAILDYYDARKQALSTSSKQHSFGAGAVYKPVPPERFFLNDASFNHLLRQREHAFFSPFSEHFSEHNDARHLPLNYRSILRFAQGAQDRTPFDQLREALNNYSSKGKAVVLACFTSGSRERLQHLLLERGFHCVLLDAWNELKQIRGKTLGLAILPLENGFESSDAAVLSESDVLGERIARTTRKKKKAELFLAEAANFTEGELVVHREHGIGRFEGLITLTVNGAAHDCLKLIYADDDKLFLPVENIELLTRFGLDEEDAKLDKLGGASWQARKARLTNRIKIAAEALLKTAAERQVRQGTVIEAPVGTYDDFCARFPYVETEDQARAIEDVLADMHSGRPMDRLICGDVGFGKTEVALRAAFVAASQGQQVAVICPTTLLARQHYRNFRERFSGFPLTIRHLSRMVPAKEQKDTREQLSEGKVDIVIGTHALLSKQMAFNRLGLVIIDEEQHFGVGQKEKLKELKAGVHVLTLSATPIPRTLQMALTGVRDLSLITTPPVDRLAVRSFVMPFDPVVLREAMLRELHRGGRCFVVTPRIKDMAEVRQKLTEIAPEARIAMAHGQMAASELDTIMNAFYDGKYDMLLSTAIIESGLDIPSANTMIIHNAHLFGLSQLYQMRGRVGRGKIRAYAYFLLPSYKTLSTNATRRLEVMQTLDTLGAGFTLASHDMDIRGFGNLVGEEQSGHIREVGIELYQQMLEEAVAQLRTQKETSSSDTRPPSSDWSPAINLGISVLIPEDYVNDLQLRLGLYRRVASMENDADIDSFAAELTDRFGPAPQEVQHLIAVLGLKLLCKQAGIERVDLGPKGAVVTFHNNLFAKPEALLTHIARHPRQLKLRPDQKLVFAHEWKNDQDRLLTIKEFTQTIARLA